MLLKACMGSVTPPPPHTNLGTVTWIQRGMPGFRYSIFACMMPEIMRSTDIALCIRLIPIELD